MTRLDSVVKNVGKLMVWGAPGGKNCGRAEELSPGSHTVSSQLKEKESQRVHAPIFPSTSATSSRLTDPSLSRSRT